MERVPKILRREVKLGNSLEYCDGRRPFTHDTPGIHDVSKIMANHVVSVVYVAATDNSDTTSVCDALKM